MGRTGSLFSLLTIVAYLSGCTHVTTTPETVTSMSSQFLCQMEGPKWFGTQDEHIAIRSELDKRGVICDNGRIVGYRPKPSPPITPDQSKPEEAPKDVGLPKTERVSERPLAYSSGSGFFVTEDGYFVTNNHVVEGNQAIVLMDVNSTKYNAAVVRTDEANDIAVLKVVGKFKALPVVSSRIAKRGMDVVTVGYPHADIQGIEPKVTQGIINSLSGISNDVRTFQISVPLQSGNSGGPLVTMEGNVIGVVAMKLSAIAVLKQTGDLPQNVNYAIKSSYLSEVLYNIPGVEQKLLQPGRKTFKNVSDLTRVIEGATAFVLTVKEQ
jgi:S1-C subfamily serine protease